MPSFFIIVIFLAYFFAKHNPRSDNAPRQSRFLCEQNHAERQQSCITKKKCYFYSVEHIHFHNWPWISEQKLPRLHFLNLGKLRAFVIVDTLINSSIRIFNQRYARSLLTFRCIGRFRNYKKPQEIYLKLSSRQRLVSKFELRSFSNCTSVKWPKINKTKQKIWTEKSAYLWDMFRFHRLKII